MLLHLLLVTGLVVSCHVYVRHLLLQSQSFPALTHLFIQMKIGVRFLLQHNGANVLREEIVSNVNALGS